MKPARTLPPVGYRVAATSLARAAAESLVPGRRSTVRFLERFAETVNVRHAFGLSSGKAALATILRALHGLTGRRKVILPAYTCYSVPSAIVLAGLDPVPCDIAKGSFDYDYEQLQPLLASDVLCILSVDLFGIASDTTRVTGLCRPMGIFVIEDAAQALGVQCNGRSLGTRGDVGFFSLGRGKNITGGSGGIVVTDSPAIADALTPLVERLPDPGAAADTSALLTLAALSMFISPGLYWFPSGLPFLRLGETIFHESFPVERLSGFSALLLRDWPATLGRLNLTRRQAAEYYLRHIEGARDYGDGIPYLRFPILVSEKDAGRIMGERHGGLLGISRMYPTSVGGIPQLEGRLGTKWFPEAERVATSLLTLPTHPLLSSGDLARICAIVNETQMASDARTLALAGHPRMR